MKKALIYIPLMIVAAVIAYLTITYLAVKVIDMVAAEQTPLVELINEARADEGLTPLAYEDGLAISAQVRADEIASSGVWSHTRPDNSDWYTTTVVKYYEAGENLAECQTTTNRAVADWMKSDTHRANILGELAYQSGDWNKVGTATAKDNRGCTIYVAHFGAL